MRKFKVFIAICIPLLAIILIINIVSSIHISYEEFAVKELNRIIADELDNYPRVEEFIKSASDLNLPEIELLDEYRSPIFKENINCTLIGNGYYMRDEKWTKAPRYEDGTMTYDLFTSTTQFDDSVYVHFYTEYLIYTSDNLLIQKVYWGSIDLRIEKLGFNEYKLLDIYTSNLKPAS